MFILRIEFRVVKKCESVTFLKLEYKKNVNGYTRFWVDLLK